MTRRTRQIALLATAVLAASAPAAHARLAVDRSLAGVELDMTSKEVRAVLGKPDRVVYPRDEIQGTVKRMDYGLTRVFLSRGVDTVHRVTTTSRRQRTGRGVGVGSTRQTLLRGVKGVRCETFGGFETCHTGVLAAGERVTDFGLDARGRVSRITLGYVID
jgi:hypothetical protein